MGISYKSNCCVVVSPTTQREAKAMRIIMLMFDTKRKESDGRISNINQKQGMHTRQWPHVYTPLLLPNNIESWWYYVVAPKSNRHFHMVLINMNFFWNLKKVVNQGPSVWLLCEIIHFQFGIFVILWRHLYFTFWKYSVSVCHR